MQNKKIIKSQSTAFISFKRCYLKCKIIRLRYNSLNFLYNLTMRDLFILIVFFVISIFAIKILWTWTIPDIFPGAVNQGLIAKNISWFSAVKLSVLFSLIATVARVSKNK